MILTNYIVDTGERRCFYLFKLYQPTIYGGYHLFRNEKIVHEYERLSNITHSHTLKSKLVVRNDMDVNENMRHKLEEQIVMWKDIDEREHERLFNITLTRSLGWCVCFVYRCLSLFIWSLGCMFFFDLRILITSLVSPNYSQTYIKGTASSKKWCGCKWIWETI